MFRKMLKTPVAVLASLCTYLDTKDHAQFFQTCHLMAKTCRLPQASAVCWKPKRASLPIIPPTYHEPRHLLSSLTQNDIQYIHWITTRRFLRTVMLSFTDDSGYYYNIHEPFLSAFSEQCRLYLVVPQITLRQIPIKLMPGLRGLHIHSVSHPEHRHADIFRQCPQLEILRLDDNFFMSPTVISSLTKLRVLAGYAFVYDDRPDYKEPRTTFPHLTKLEILDLCRSTANALSVNTQLISLTIRPHMLQGLTELTGLTKLREISFSTGCGFDLTSVPHVSALLSQLTAFRILETKGIWIHPWCFPLELCSHLPNVTQLELCGSGTLPTTKIADYEYLRGICNYGMKVPKRKITLTVPTHAVAVRSMLPPTMQSYFDTIVWKPPTSVGRLWFPEQFDSLRLQT